jgi:hypothetical protein
VSEDTEATLAAVRALGAGVEGHIASGRVVVTGRGVRGLVPPPVIDCMNAGTLMRLVAGILVGQPPSDVTVLDGDASGRVCEDGVCRFSDCFVDAQCGNRICVDGTCAQRIACVNDEACSDDGLCIDNVCRPPCLSDDDKARYGRTEDKPMLAAATRCTGAFDGG